VSAEPLWKRGRDALRRERNRRRRRRKKVVKDAAAEVRKRDKVCRFPRCGCRRLGMTMKAWPEVSHAQHRGMGGNPTGDRSTTALMALLCKWRHQDAPFSRHKGTLRHVPLTDRGFDGPVRWEIDILAMPGWTPERREFAQNLLSEIGRWRPIWIETAPGVGAAPDDWAEDVLTELASMEV
jgi:hypothetical protein